MAVALVLETATALAASLAAALAVVAVVVRTALGTPVAAPSSLMDPSSDKGIMIGWFGSENSFSKDYFWCESL